MPVEALSRSYSVKKKGKKTEWPTAERFVNDETYRENMPPSETPSQEIIVGIGTNLYYQEPYRSADHPVTNYPISAYLKFPTTSTDLLALIYRYFGYDNTNERVSKPKKGWVITDECGDYYLPELFFSNTKALTQFLYKIGEHGKLKEVRKGNLVTIQNMPSIIAMAIS